MGAFVEGEFPFVRDAIFSKPIYFPFFLLSSFFIFHASRNKLEATILAWCPDIDSVIHKYLAEMRRLARDETPFSSVM
jgi:hypothetical protein